MPNVEANGLTIAYDQVGSGPPLILLHGATSRGREQFAPVVSALARYATMLTPDARSHAGTRWDVRAGWSAELLVDDLAAFADALSLATFHLLGYSMGAMTALAFAARHPERVRTLVLMSLTPEREPRLSVGRRLMDPDRIEREDPAWATRLAARHDPVQGPGAWIRLHRAIVADLETQRLLEPRELRGITAPTLVVVGDRDPFAPVGQAAALARQVRDGRLLVLPDAGHDVLAERVPVLEAALLDHYGSALAVDRG